MPSGVPTASWWEMTRAVPTDLPWAVAFPRGLPRTAVPVHPTQLYEAIPLVFLAWALVRWRRVGVPDWIVLGRYSMLAGALRFAIEFIRVIERVLGPLTIAHLVSLALMVIGLVLLWSTSSRPARQLIERQLP
jgi:phosphatidylglycerol:prolipoprotein diacylglycerol transferase